MTYSAEELTIQVFPNINDKPIAPTASKAGNGSHMVNQFNKLVEQVFSNNVGGASDQWSIISTSREVETKERLLIAYSGESVFRLPLPNDFNVGDYFSVIFVAGLALQITTVDKVINNQFPEYITVDVKFVEINFVLVDVDTWAVYPFNNLIFYTPESN